MNHASAAPTRSTPSGRRSRPRGRGLSRDGELEGTGIALPINQEFVGATDEDRGIATSRRGEGEDEVISDEIPIPPLGDEEEAVRREVIRADGERVVG